MDHKTLACLAQMASSKSNLLMDEARLWKLISHALSEEVKQKGKKPREFSAPSGIENTDPVPEVGLMRIDQVLKLIPVSKSKWWDGIKAGVYPKPYKISTGVTVWKNSDILDLIEKMCKRMD